MATSAVSVATAALAGDEHASGGTRASQVIHTVYFWLKRPDYQADRKALIAGLKTLQQVPVIKSLHVGGPPIRNNVMWLIIALMCLS